MSAAYFIIFGSGLIFGSFLNVLIYRLPIEEDFVRKPSHCPKCGKALKFWELIPVLSFFILGGKCSGCRIKISWQYPAVEILSGILWVAVFYHNFSLNFDIWNLRLVSDFGFRILSFTYDIFILSSLLVISIIDIRSLIIPDKIIYPVAAVSVFYALVISLAAGDFATYLVMPLLAAGASFIFFFLLFFFSEGRAMGLGDGKLAFVIGMFLGAAQTLSALFWAFVIGALFGIILIAQKKKKLSSQLAFGPFLAAGTFIAYLVPWQSFMSFIENFLVRFY